MKKYIAPALFLILLITTTSNAAKMRIAIMNFKAKGVSQSLAENVSELIRGEMINTGKFIVIERDQMNKILKEQGLQKSGCTDVSCSVEIGKILSAKKILIGTVMELGGTIVITARIVDVQSGTGEFSEKQNAKSKSDLYNAVTIFTEKLSRRITGKAGPYVSSQALEMAPEVTGSYSTGMPFRHNIAGIISILNTEGTTTDDSGDSPEVTQTVNQNIYAIAYSFFFKQVEGMNLPNDLKQFILAPSYVTIGAGTGSEDLENEGGSSYSLSSDWSFFNIEGTYYFPSRTGILVSYQSISNTISNDYVDIDSDTEEFIIGLNQYLGNTHVLYFHYSNTKTEISGGGGGFNIDVENISKRYTFGWAKATGTSSRFFLNLETRLIDVSEDGEDWSDVYGFKILFGPAMARFAIYFLFDLELEAPVSDSGNDYTSFQFTFGVNPVYWFKDKIGIGLNPKLSVLAGNDDSDTNSYSETSVSLGIDIYANIRM